jgi:hypothetical protein
MRFLPTLSHSRPMRSSPVFSCGLALLAAVGCASAHPQGTTTYDEPHGLSWSGSLQPTQQRTGALAVTGQNRAFGQVRITPAPGNLPRMHVTITVAVPTATSTSLRWAVLPERCGNGDLPLLGFEQFPIIDISVNGRGQLDTDLPLELTANGLYHVNIYNGGQGLENVVTCANLKLDS